MGLIEWILERCDGKAGAKQTPVGWTPRSTDLELRELPGTEAALKAALRVDVDEWREELGQHGRWLAHLGKTVPRALTLQHDLLLETLGFIVARTQHPERRAPAP